MKINCPKCKQEYEIEEQYIGQSVQCQTCQKEFTVSASGKPFVHQFNVASEVKTNVKQGAIIGAWVCLIIGVILNLITNFMFFIWGPLYLAAFILAIVAMSQRRILGGILAMIATLVIPIIIISYNCYIGAEVIQKAINENKYSSVNSDIATNTTKIKNNPQSSEISLINGAFGYTLGSVLRDQDVVRKTELTNGDPLYEVVARTKLRDINEFYVLITPIGHKIYAIWGQCKYDQRDKAEEEQKIINAFIEKKYGKMEKYIFSLEPRYRLSQNEKWIVTSVDKSLRSSLLSVKYVDVELLKVADEEKIKQASKNVDSSAL
ncbi:MAG: hypothetical protein JXR78_04630 [Victivallales bacterium]|nr:hypothetical protein [Victivallales bacterium]